jgi:uncharacterized protein YcfL
MRYTSVKLTALAGLATLLVGCANNSCITIPSQGGNASNTNFGSGLLGSVAVSPTSDKLVGDLLIAKVSLQNKTDKNQIFNYQFQWFSDDGFNQGNPTPWTPITLLPHMSKVVSSVAPTNATTRYNVLICNN